VANVAYFVEIDRAGDSDIIFESGMNQIASDDMQKALTPLADVYGFSAAYGSYTDVNDLTETAKRCAINISAGYHHAHTNLEYVNLNELSNTIDCVSAIARNVRQSFVWDTGNLYRSIYTTDYFKPFHQPHRRPVSYTERKYWDLDEILNLARVDGADNNMLEYIRAAYNLGQDDAVYHY
jgi:hypothetical protein